MSGRGECVCEGIGVSSMLRLIRRTGLSDEPRHPRCGQLSIPETIPACHACAIATTGLHLRREGCDP